jgi:hypothetical protein
MHNAEQTAYDEQKNNKIMKKILLTTAIICLLFAGCDKEDELNIIDNGNGPLLEFIIESTGDSTKFEYNNQRRITKISTYKNHVLYRSHTLTYSGNDLVKMVTNDNTIVEFVRKGTTVRDKQGTMVIHLNNDGTLAKFEQIWSDNHSQTIVPKYKDGNIINLATSDDYIFAESRHDNKKSLFHHCKTPKWFLMITSEYLYGNKNNVTFFNHFWGVTKEYEYEYNDAGFPIKSVETRQRMGEAPRVITTRYEYR